MPGPEVSAASKKALRARLKAARSRLTSGERAATDHAIALRVQELVAWKQAPMVYAYLSFAEEVDTRELVGAALAQGKRVALPRVVGPHVMRWFFVDGLDGLEVSPYGIEEPAIDVVCEASGDGAAGALALVPGLAFDGAGMRLGYGGGYYDAFLDRFRGISVGLCRAAFLTDVLPAVEAHDRAVDIVVTEVSRAADGVVGSAFGYPCSLEVGGGTRRDNGRAAEPGK